MLKHKLSLRECVFVQVMHLFKYSNALQILYCSAIINAIHIDPTIIS